MATYTANAPSDNSTVANYKAWAQAISAGFAAIGWVQTGDTGQVNWASVVSLPANNYNNYEVWRANDAQAATLPIYVRIGYGQSSGFVGIQFTVGTGSNGSGTITNPLSGFNAFANTTSNAGATAYPCYFGGDAGEFRMALFVTMNNSSQLVFAIERSKDSSGNKTADYFTVVWMQGGSCRQQTCTGVATSVSPHETWTIAVVTGTNTRATAFYNGSVAAFPFFPLLGTLGNPMIGIMACVAGDVADNTIVTVTSLYGSTHTYVVTKGGTGVGISGCARANNFGNNCAVLLRYE